MIRWLAERRELLAELRHAEHVALDERAARARADHRADSADRARRLAVTQLETALRALDELRSENAQLEAAVAVDLAAPVLPGEHRNCVRLADHMAVVNELDRLKTTPRRS